MAHSTLQTPLTAAHAGVAQAERTLQEVQALERQRRAERHEVEDTIRRAQTAGDAEALAPLLGRREALIHVIRSLEGQGQEAAQAVTLARQRVQAVYHEASPTASQFEGFTQVVMSMPHAL
jgi:hypothetical protein